MNMRLIAIFVLTLASTYALPAEEYEFMSEFPVDGDAGDIMLLARTAVKKMKAVGAKNKDCEDLAKTMCKEVADSITETEKLRDVLYTRQHGTRCKAKQQKNCAKSAIGSKCSTDWDDKVAIAEREVITRKRAYDDLKDKITSIEKYKITYKEYTFEQMMKGECPWAYTDIGYKKVKEKYEETVRDKDKAEGRWTESKETLKNEKKTRKEKQAKCFCDAKKAWKAWSVVAEKKTATVIKNGKMCKMMSCVLRKIPHSNPDCAPDPKKIYKITSKDAKLAPGVSGACGFIPREVERPVVREKTRIRKYGRV